MTEAMRLSEAGAQRRAAMRQQLMTAVVSRRRRRRGAEAVLTVLLVAGAAFWVAERLDAPLRAPAPFHGPLAGPHVEFVANDASVLARLAAGGPPATVRTIDDAELITLLDGLGRPAGLARGGGRVAVVPQVADDWTQPE